VASAKSAGNWQQISSAYSAVSDATHISTSRRIEYARGYIDLGLFDRATEELEAIPLRDWFTSEVMTIRLELHSAAKQWNIVENYARTLILKDRTDIQAWVALGCAARRTRSVGAARDTMVDALAAVGDGHPAIHYNLACYQCLLGNVEAAKEHLSVACRIDSSFKSAALGDDDLKPMWEAIVATP
jgi:thioredoxin-like negative regulator of GroEL